MSEILIVGSGIAGLRSALLLAEFADVRLVTKKSISESNTNYAQGGIASVLDGADSFDSHVEDTLRAGAGLCHPAIVRAVVEAGPRLIADLEACGIRFSGGGAGQRFALGREGGHSHRRIVHAGDFTGREMERSLVDRVREHPRIEILEEHFAVDLCVRGGRAAGAWVLAPGQEEAVAIPARATLLATGGSGKVYRYTSNPDIATGDGLAMAYRAGATVSNLEFFQFHPTCLFHPDAKNFLISEAVRGEGAILRRIDGHPFLADYDLRADLAPRDVVARAIDSEMKARGEDHVLLDTTVIGADAFRARFPNIHERCTSHGLDPTKDPLPVVPAAHYQCGGVLVDGQGASDVPGLYVIGEAACTGLHGANRLASNSLLEAVYFAHEACARIRQDFDALPDIQMEGLATFGDEVMPRTALRHDWETARRTMWDYVGIVRDAERLTIAQERLSVMREECERWLSNHRADVEALELRNVTLLGELQARCALARTESRGLHYRSDHPNRDDITWRGDSLLRHGGEPELRPWSVRSAEVQP